MMGTTDMRAELSAAIGYMRNAKIDLETGATKATAIRTISGGIERAEAALAKIGLRAESGWQPIETAPEDEHVILCTTGGHVGEALMLRDEDTGKQKWTWALGPVSQFHIPLGWMPLPEAIAAALGGSNE
jgi:hypothetical protein